MKFELEPYHRNIPDEELLEDLRRIAKMTGKNTVSKDEYKINGKFSVSTFRRRFVRWNNALELAGLDISIAFNLPDKELFDNIKNIWIKLGRQPKYGELHKSVSRFSVSTYENRFGTWRKALEAFVSYINENEEDETLNEDSGKPEIQEYYEIAKPKHKTKREISERLRFKILLRDGFRCQSCGRSPIKSPGIELHIDHKIPYSKGGETIPENLVTKCKECNLGKGNLLEN